MLTLQQVRSHAWREAGPLDFVINLVVNTGIAWLVFRHSSVVPLVGVPSLLIVAGPTCFLMPLFTTFFGYRRIALHPEVAPHASPVAWRPVAWRTSLIRAVVGATCGVGLILAIHFSTPGVVLTRWTTIALLGLGSAVGAYFCHASAVIACGKLYTRSGIISTR